MFQEAENLIRHLPVWKRHVGFNETPSPRQHLETEMVELHCPVLVSDDLPDVCVGEEGLDLSEVVVLKLARGPPV